MKENMNDKRTGKFSIRTDGELVNGSRLGIDFEDSVGFTDDGIKAHACLEFGYEVILTADGKPAFPIDEKPPKPSAGHMTVESAPAAE